MLLSIPSAHTEVVTSLQFSPHHVSIFCSTSGDDTAALWDLRHAPGDCETARFSHHVGPVNHALFLPDDAWALLTASDDRTIARWDLRDVRTPVATLGGFGDGVNKVLYLPGEDPRIVSACDDGLVYTHALASSSTGAAAVPPVDRFWAATNTVNDLALAPTPGLLYTASEDCAIRLWHINPPAHGNGFNHLSNVHSSDNDNTVEMENDQQRGGRLVATFEEFENPVNHISVLPGACVVHGDNVSDNHIGSTTSWIYAACSEFVFAVDLDPQTSEFGSGALTFAGHTDYVRGLEFISDDTLLTVSDDSTAIEWSLRTTEPVRQVKLHEGLVMASATSITRGELLTGTDGGEIRAWRLPFNTETYGRV